MLNSINVKYWELCHPSGDLGYHRDSDYNAKCDICGDSKKDKTMKRMHLYTKSSYEGDIVACFNCGYSKSMHNYLKEYHPDLFNAYKSEMYGEKFNSFTQANTIVEVKAVKAKSNLTPISIPESFIKASESELAREYLNKRGITDHTGFYYSPSKVNLKDKQVNLENYIIKPLLDINGDWYGFYSRSLDKKVFYTYIPEENTGYKVHNWFKINKKDKLYIFEAIFNELSTNFTNKTSSLGSDIDPDRLAELSNPIFCFDNDETGRTKALKYAKKGCSVFVWNKGVPYKDFNDMLQDGYSREEITAMIEKGISTPLMAIAKLKMF